MFHLASIHSSDKIYSKVLEVHVSQNSLLKKLDQSDVDSEEFQGEIISIAS